ncbi:MAG: glycosyltransferase family 39 protein [Candidatus Riflebacteria bacterium]|nr:glycosyltransferase family 39 protein [Candidatus Riflebacteria bacterium]
MTAVRSRSALAMALAALLLFTFRSSSRGLWNPDEPREAEIAREMFADGDWALPHLNGQPFVEKPPLYAWLSCVCFWILGGPDPLAARLPSSICGALLVLITVIAARRLVAPDRAWIAGLSLSTMPLLWWHSSRANLDVPLSLFIGVALLCFLRAYLRAGGQEGPVWGLDVVVGAIALGLGFLTKGPVAAVLPGLIVITFLATEGNLWFLRRVPWVRVLALVSIVVLPWAIPFCLRDGGRWARDMVVVHHLELAIGVTAVSWHRPAGTVLRFAWAWLMAPVLFFSVSACKRDLYLLPAFPAVALLSVASVDLLDPDRRWARRLAGASLTFAAVALVVVGILFVRLPVKTQNPHIAEWIASQASTLGGLTLVFCAAGVSVGVLAVRSRYTAAVACLGVPAGCAALVALGALLPALDPVKSGRALFAELASPRGVVGYRLMEGDLGIFTFQRQGPIPLIQDPAEMERHLASGSRVVVQADKLDRDLSQLGRGAHVVARAPVGDSEFLLIDLGGRSDPKRR